MFFFIAPWRKDALRGFFDFQFAIFNFQKSISGSRL